MDRSGREKRKAQTSRHLRHDRKTIGESDNSSLSSLGSLPEATSVVLQFNEDLPSQRRFTTHLASSSSKHARVEESRFPPPKDISRQSMSNRTCPHCKKTFANAFAVPKHISQVHNRAGEFHCSKCTFKHRSKQSLDQHERITHRTCPICKKVFVLLDRHLQHCARR